MNPDWEWVSRPGLDPNILASIAETWRTATDAQLLLLVGVDQDGWLLVQMRGDLVPNQAAMLLFAKAVSALGQKGPESP